MWLCGSMLHVYLYQDLHFILIGQLHVDLRSDWTVRFSIVFWLNSDMLYCVLIEQWHVLMADNQVALDHFHTSLGSEELTCIMHIKVIENREVNEKGSSLGPNGKCPKWELALGTLHLHYYHNTRSSVSITLAFLHWYQLRDHYTWGDCLQTWQKKVRD